MFKNIFNKLFKVNTEVEGEENLDHDIVMIMSDGKLVEVTKDGTSVQEQE